MGGIRLILLDTHTLVWLDAGDRKLGGKALEELDRALPDDQLTVSAISFWEIGMLLRKGRLSLGLDLGVWRSDLLTAGVSEIPVSGDIAVKAAGLDDFHGDPADRIIVATALHAGAVLYTVDSRMLEWTGPVLRSDASV